MSEQVYTVEEQRLVDTFGSISTMLEVLSSQQVLTTDKHLKALSKMLDLWFLDIQKVLESE